jgi:hypothetical protein
MTRTMENSKKGEGNFIDKPRVGKEQRHGGAYPTGANYITKEGRRLAPLPRRLPRRGRPLRRSGLEVGAADAGSVEDPHRGL